MRVIDGIFLTYIYYIRERVNLKSVTFIMKLGACFASIFHASKFITLDINNQINQYTCILSGKGINFLSVDSTYLINKTH